VVIKILEFDSPDNYCVDSLTFVTEKKNSSKWFERTTMK
jgi:hypothetical protein